MNLRFFPNILTLMRILLTPVVILLLLSSGKHVFVAGLVFILASLTDYYDGRLARKYGLISKSGIFLDPVADKVLVLSTFFSFYLLGLLSLWMVIAITMRELVVTGLRLLLLKQGYLLAASPLGKWKTGIQFAAIGFLFLVLLCSNHEMYIPLPMVTAVMYFVVFFTCYSGVDYFIKNREKIRLFMQRVGK